MGGFSRCNFPSKNGGFFLRRRRRLAFFPGGPAFPLPPPKIGRRERKKLFSFRLRRQVMSSLGLLENYAEGEEASGGAILGARGGALLWGIFLWGEEATFVSIIPGGGLLNLNLSQMGAA